MKQLIISFVLTALALPLTETSAQDSEHFRNIVTELSSARYQGRGYARDGVRKAARYIAKEYRRAGADAVEMQPFTLDINTFPGRMRMSVDGRRLTPGSGFTVREYSSGAHGSGSLYYIDTLDYDSDRIMRDMHDPQYEGCYVVFDFWSSYEHKEDFVRLQSDTAGCVNAGVIFTWDEPLKFYKAYGDMVLDKPIIWVSSDFPKDAKSVRLDIDNRFLANYHTENVIARIDGNRHDSCYVFTAHYDHLGNMGRRLFFPGANDNASGTAGIITLAEYFAQHKPEYDMYFISFSGEEAGLRGSEYFVEHPTFPLSQIRYLFNLDMIGDNNPIQYCEVSEQGISGLRRMQLLNEKEQYFKEMHQGELAANSDHWPFAEKGVPCILFENENGDAFPYYHTAEDNMTTVRFDTYEPVTRLIIDYINSDK